MKLKEKVDFLINKLEEIYPTLEIPLDHKDPYTLLIAVLLSAQSTDKKVNEITPNLFNKADNPYDMIKLSIDEIREIIKPVGLSPTKSKGIWNLSKILIDKYNGRVPEDISMGNVMYGSLNLKEAKAVAEFGAGDGVFTTEILKLIGPNTKFFVFETNDLFIKILKEKINDDRVIIIKDSAEKIGEYIKKIILKKLII